jgi:60 kDa SS-A/Ro ribonucleoprotein
VLFALNTYKEGHGFRGSLTWTPVSRIVDALDEAFYLSFGAVTPTGKRILIGLDLSGSMGGAMIAGTNISARVASCAMSMVTARVESDYHIVGFTSTGGYDFMSRGNAKSSQTYSSKNGNNWNASNGLTVLDISPRRRLDDICKYTEALPMGGTDCALPMMYALDNKMKFDAFIVYTDSETWAGDIKPFQALKMYRDAMGIPARLIVVGMTATDFSIADPNDAGMLDVVGFDTAAPNFMSDFIRGEL